ncbi:MAG: hypothetical protein WC045_02130 [Patescibacteria group bacterium]
MKKDDQNVNSQKISTAKKPRSTGPYKKDVYADFFAWSLLSQIEKHTAGVATAEAFAKKHNLTPSHLSRWKQRDDFRDNLHREQVFRIMEFKPDILHALTEQCIKHGKASDVELWLRYFEGWDSKNPVKTEPPVRFTPDDFKSMIEFLPPEKQHEHYVALARLRADMVVAEQRAKEQGIKTDYTL